MKAAVLHEVNKPLVIEDVSVPNPGPREVLIRTRVAGLCHSDLHFMEGLYPHPLPAVLGHESAGVVEKVGSDVTYVKPGDHVVTCLSVFCGTCDNCTTGRTVLCTDTTVKMLPGQSNRLSWARSEKLLSEHPNSRSTFLVDGSPPRAGQIFRNPDLARSLRRIAEHGRDGYYQGPTAQAIVDIVREQGGAMELDDLSAFQPEWVQPIETTYRGWTVTEIPPNSQGIAALEMLNVLERFPLGEWGFHSTRALHAMIEAKKLAYADLIRYVGDPRFGRMPVADLLGKEGAAARAEKIDPHKASCKVEPTQLAAVTDAKGSDTIYLTVTDRDGNIVSLIQSNYAGFGSGLVPKGAGFMLHNRGALFTLAPGQPNTLAPRKRPIHTIIPGFLRKGDVRIGFGIMGGLNQALAHAQFVSDIADHGMTIQQALEAGRFTKGTFEGCDVEIESSVPESVRNELSALGHQLEVRPPRTPNFGYGQAVLFDRKSGVKFGASDPRHDGEAIPVPGPAFDDRSAQPRK